MAADYFAAGSDLVLTNSFGGNRIGLERYGFEDRVREFNRLAAEHARSQAGDRRFVVGSVGLTASTHFLLGSVASTVLHHAPCDVLVVHTK